ncbi:hypothetical protein BS78_10G135200 [Paspalum vaginatum]|nr:hypothetical protein BS78_10G135200 [Paspalum vaginatum]
MSGASMLPTFDLVYIFTLSWILFVVVTCMSLSVLLVLPTNLLSCVIVQVWWSSSLPHLMIPAVKQPMLFFSRRLGLVIAAVHVHVGTRKRLWHRKCEGISRRE